MPIWSEQHFGFFRKNNDLSKNVIVNVLNNIKPKIELFCSYLGFIGLASFGGKEKGKEKKEVRTHDKEPPVSSNLQAVA